MGKTSLALLTWWKHPLKMRWKEYISDVAEELRSVVSAWMEFWSEARRGNVGEFEFDGIINECFPGNFPIFTLLTFHYNATQPRILTSNFLHWLKAITDSFPSRASQKRWQLYWKLKSIVNRAENPSPYGEWAINYGRRLTLNSKVSPRNCFSHGREPASRGSFSTSDVKLFCHLSLSCSVSLPIEIECLFAAERIHQNVWLIRYWMSNKRAQNFVWLQIVEIFSERTQ